MRITNYLASIAALALIFLLPAFAKDLNSGKFTLTQSARIGSTVLQPGHYTAEWSGSNHDVNVTILSHGKTVATAHGQLKEMPGKSPYTSVTTHTGSNNTQQVDEIDFDHRTEALMLAGA
ncbi:MAG TPA: hypothetical protein VMS18_09260 [Candidatus Binatia bacterium]|nr:hypothetical protein [Candidatus Binatia bacterium]